MKEPDNASQSVERLYKPSILLCSVFFERMPAKSLSPAAWVQTP